MTIECFLATSCIKRVVGPSGIFSVALYHFVFCSAQKYGPVKISCMQTIFTSSFPACSRNFRCFSMLASRIFSSGASVGPAWLAWIKPHFTTRAIQFSLWFRRGRCNAFAAHQQPVDGETQSEGDEPRVGVNPVEQVRIGYNSARRRHCPDEPGNDRENRQHQRDHRPRVDAVAVAVAPANSEQVVYGELLASDHPVIGDQNSTERTHQARISKQPGENVRGGVRVESPRHHDYAEHCGEEPAGDVADSPWAEIGEVVRRRHYVGGHVGRQLRREHYKSRKDDNRSAADSTHENDRIPYGLAENDYRRARDSDTDKSKGSHRRRKADRLTQYLRALAFRVASEVWNVETEGCPIADIRRKRGREQRPE